MHGKFDDLGRFADPSLLILTSLADGPKHGYAIMTDVAEFGDVAMEPGTLYGALTRLEEDVVRSLRETELVAEDLNRQYEEALGWGDRLSDRMAAFGGSWRYGPDERA